MAANSGLLAILIVVSSLQISTTKERMSRKSPAWTPNIPVFGRFSPGTKFDRDCMRTRQCNRAGRAAPLMKHTTKC